MQKHTLWAWALLIIVLALDGVAYWAMVWRKDLPISLLCLLLAIGVLLESYRRWRWSH